MKNLLLCLIALLIFNISSLAQAPEKFKYQAIITDNKDHPVRNKTIGLEISILQSNLNGIIVYQETFTTRTSNAGLVNLEIGTGIITSGVFSDINWGVGPYYLGIAVDMNGSGNYISMGASQLLSVPYALYAKQAEFVEGDLDTDPTNEIELPETANENDILTFNGSEWVALENADGDPTNEIQVLTLEGNVLSLSEGGEVTLPVDNFKFYYADRDADGYGDKWGAIYSDLKPDGYVNNDTDCDDTNGAVNSPVTYYVDSDGDGFGSTTSANFCSSTAPSGYSDNNTDCDDTDGAVNSSVTYYVDLDGDGFGSTTSANFCSSTAPSGYSNNNTDCDDTNGAVNRIGTYYVDADGDGFGSTTSADFCSSTVPSGYSNNNTDCNDSDATINPGATDILNDGIDNNCDGEIDNIAIGDFYEDGIVFYIAPTPTDLDGNGTLDTGLACAIVDQSDVIQWSNGSDIATGATDEAIGTGSINTDAIIAVQGAVETDYAAGLARAYNGGGHTDWFLPSIDELIEMYINGAAINATAIANGGVAFSGNYWSSTEIHSYLVWTKSFSNGRKTAQYKYFTAPNLRAVRAF